MIHCQETLDSLSDMYELLQEEDMWSGLWQKHARYRETNVAIAYEQQGFFEQAQVSLLKDMYEKITLYVGYHTEPLKICVKKS